MAIHFRFKSSKEFETLSIDGAAMIKLEDLKRAIVTKKNMQRGLDFELNLTNNLNGEGPLPLALPPLPLTIQPPACVRNKTTMPIPGRTWPCTRLFSR
jgi:hypothetical protein